MAKAIEMTSSIEDMIKDSEVIICIDKRRTFKYELNDKAAKAKLIKGAKRIPFEIVEKSASSNLIFSIGAWDRIVNPSVHYCEQVQGNKSCGIGSTTITVVSVKKGTETSGKHIDTQIVFLFNREKVVCHFYNTTQLILVNGHGYLNMIKCS